MGGVRKADAMAWADHGTAGPLSRACRDTTARLAGDRLQLPSRHPATSVRVVANDRAGAVDAEV
jgi:hypothetical protein